MTTPSTYLLVNEELYRQGKIDILSAKSGILLSREKVKRINMLVTSEKTYKTKISHSVSTIKLSIKKFLDQLPKAREAIDAPEKREILIKRKIPNAKNDVIRDELAIITSKLEELEKL